MLLALRIAVALALLVGLGHGLVALIGRETRLFWHERWAAAWVLGCGAGALAWFVLSPLYAWVSPIVALTLLMVGVAVTSRAEALRHRWHNPSEHRWHSSSGLWWHSPSGLSIAASEAALGLVLVTQVVALLVLALHTPLGWDGLFNFEMKARLAFEHVPAGQLPSAYFSDASRTWSHPQYPLLVPFTEFWLYSWAGRINQSAVKVIFPLFYLSLIGIVAGAARRVANRRAGVLAAIALGWLPPLTLIPGAASGYADVPLAAAVAGAGSFALIGFTAGSRNAVLLGGTLSAAAVWTKVEGLMLAVVIGLAASVVTRRRPGALLWLPLVAALPWFAFQRLYGGTAGGDFLDVTPMIFLENLERVPIVASLAMRELIRPGHWALVWPAFLFLLVLMMMRKADAVDRFLAAAVLVPLTLYPLIYVFSAWPDVRTHVGTSLSRTLVPLAPLALVFIIRRLYADSSREARQWA